MSTIKAITRLGLMTMEPEARKERLEHIMEGNTIDCSAMADLIDECKAALMLLIYKKDFWNFGVKNMLERINGKQIVRDMDPDELAAWAIDLKENRTIMSAGELASVARALMKME